MFNPTVRKELLSICILIFFALMLYYVPSSKVHAWAFVAMVAMFTVYLISVLGQTDRDEREEEHRAQASEAGFAVGGVLVFGAIAHQAFIVGKLDPWLFVILLGMLFVRLIMRLILHIRN